MSGVLGIDIGGSGIKGNLVDPSNGTLLAERVKFETPVPSVPEAVAKVVLQIADHFVYRGRIGSTFPAIVKKGVTLSAANVDRSWIGCDAAALFSQVSGREVMVVNDADAAGVAEMTVGAGRGRAGTVVLLTFGTGIGSAVFYKGVLLPNTEFGHLEFSGHAPVEDWAAARVKDDENLSWKAWAGRVDKLLHHLNQLFSPDLFILGGGVSRRWDKWSEHLSVPVETVPAAMRNEAGIVGAAILAANPAQSPLRENTVRNPQLDTTKG